MRHLVVNKEEDCLPASHIAVRTIGHVHGGQLEVVSWWLLLTAPLGRPQSGATAASRLKMALIIDISHYIHIICFEFLNMIMVRIESFCKQSQPLERVWKQLMQCVLCCQYPNRDPYVILNHTCCHCPTRIDGNDHILPFSFSTIPTRHSYNINNDLRSFTRCATF